MAGLQTIIDSCDGLTIDRRKVVGIQLTRNEIPRVSQTPTLNPWKFTLSISKGFPYNEARGLMEALDALDRTQSEVITFSNNPKFSWMFRYQGQMSIAQQNTLNIVSFTGNQMVLGNLPNTTANRILFQPNDLIQVRGYPFPFTVVNQVLRGTAGTVTITTNRPNILGTVNGIGIVIGNSCQFKMFCPNMPAYKLNVGGRQFLNGQLVGNAYVTFEDSFQLYEYVSAI